MYDLKCPQAQYFKGEVGTELAEVINNFVKENTTIEKIEVPIKEYFYDENNKKDWRYTGEKEIEEKITCKINTASANFFILAPAESFIQDNPKSMNATLFYRERSDDNVIFENDHLIEIYSWGNNYSNSRMFNSILHLQNHNNYNKHGDKINESETLTIAGWFYITLFIMLIFSIGSIIINKMEIIYINLFFATVFIINLLIVKSNLKHFESWNQNKY